jgi:hypothetical protein
LRPHLEALIQDKRLVVFFDGIDEMSRVQYGARISALSDFAGTHQNRIKAIFSCRINDFTPEFVHRQIVLLPFDDAQIRDFIAKNYGQSNLLVDNRRISAQDLYEIVVSEEWTHTLCVPQFLHLFIFFLKVRKAWPKSRKEMLDLFFEAEYEEFAAESGKLNKPVCAPTAVFAGWARVAHEISVRDSGTSIARTAMAELPGPGGCGWPAVVEAGLRCGVFELVEQEDDSIGFAHHRYQEYFTARHIDDNGSDIDWPAHIDEARWQETIIHLTSSASSSPAIAAISQSIADVDKQVDAKDPAVRAEQERRIADRVEFASKVVRSYNARTFAALPGLIAQCVQAILWLVRHGNPITKVKMLWASINLPPFDEEKTVLDCLLHSNVQWVRRQALIILTSRQALRSSPSNFGYELALDLAEHVFLTRAFSYWSVVRQSRGLWSQWCYLWAWLCFIGSTFALGASWLLTVRLAAAMVAKALLYSEIVNHVSAYWIGLDGHSSGEPVRGNVLHLSLAGRRLACAGDVGECARHARDLVPGGAGDGSWIGNPTSSLHSRCRPALRMVVGRSDVEVPVRRRDGHRDGVGRGGHRALFARNLADARDEPECGASHSVDFR